MSQTDDKVPPPADTPTDEDLAIAALTRIARRSRTLGSGTDNEQLIREDFAGVLHDVLLAVAANVGGPEQLITGRPGSWEAEHVYALAGGGARPEDVLPHRTAPVVIHIRPEAELEGFGLRDLLDEERGAVDHECDQADTALIEAGLTPDERTRRAELEALADELLAGGQVWHDDAVTNRYKQAMRELRDLADAAQRRGRERDSQAAAAHDAATAEAARFDALWEADVAAYRDAVLDTACRLLRERGIDVPVELDQDTPSFPMPGEFYDELADEITAQTLEAAPLPMTGAPPDHSDGTPAQAVARAGLGYAARLAASGT